MPRLYDNVLQAIGNTPNVRISKITAGYPGELFAKLEYLNPANSVKDRMALKIVDDLEASGALKPGGTIIEATSGNTGAGIAMVAAVRGYKTIFVMADKQSEEKRAALRAYGARVVVCPTDVDPSDDRSYYKVAARLVRETPNSVYANQYHNQSNPEGHYISTGPEIWEQFEGKLDFVVCCLGTGGTAGGIARFLKEKDPKIRMVGVDPVGSLYFDYFHTGQLTQPFTYMVEGFGEDFLPSTMDFQYVDDVVRVNDKESFVMTRRLLREEGVFGGSSSGSAVAGALKWMKANATPEMRGVAIMPDSGTRYLSKVYNDNWMRENGFLEPEIGLGTVAELCAHKGKRDLVTLGPDIRITEAIGVLKVHGISQIPVVDGGKVLGVVHESRLLERALAGSRSDASVRDIAEATYCTVDRKTEIGVLTELFKRSKVAIVIDGGLPIDIITRIDLIDYISRVANNQRSQT